MNKLLILTGAIFCASFSTFSQVSKGGTPYSFYNEYNQNLTKSVQQITLSAPNSKILEDEDKLAHDKGSPFRVATNISVNISPQNSGTWQVLDNGDKLWRLSIKSDNALALGLYMESSIHLPKGSMLFIHNENKKQILGAYTPELNNVLNPIQAIEMVEGDKLFLEYYAPNGTVGQPQINISQVSHFYRNVENHLQSFKSSTESIEKAESCQVNVACSEASAWQDQVDAVVHYTFSDGSNTYVCSGSMIANTSGDCTPYLLTADHCGNKTSTSSLNTNVWYFKYENPNCSPGNTAQYAKPSTTMTGAIFRASSKNGSHSATTNQVYGSDFTLVELNSQPPASYQVYYAGWDKSNTAASSGVSIHHPAGHDKKISTYTSSLNSATYNGGLSSAHWEVVWSSTANGHGVTEGGSSGSPIFNHKKRIVGDLSGGSSYCSAPTSSDLYGKMSVSWDQLGSNSNAQLKAWLDPTNTGVQYIDGMRPPCSTAPAGCSATVASFPYSEGFESGIGQWTQASNDDLDWINHSGTTPSSNTGPTSSIEGSKYLYIEASSPNYPSKLGSILSPCLNLSNLNGSNLKFSYHMFGSSMGSLSVDISTDDGVSWTTGLWSKSGDQTNAWNQATVDLSSYDGQTVVIRLAGSTGSSYTSDICIDNLSVQGSVTTPPPTPTPSSCSNTVTSFPYNQGFESGINNWIQVSSDNLDWTSHNGTTPSSNTGASSAAEGSQYLYIEASSPNYPSKSAQIISPCFDLSNTNNPSLSFSYHMYGAAMGSLSIEVSSDSGSNWSTAIWSKSGDQSNTWKNVTIDLSAYDGQTIALRFSGLTGTGYTSDICIDGVSIDGTTTTPPPSPSSCTNSVASFPYNEGFETGTGLWSQTTGDDLDWTNYSGSTPSGNTGATSAHEGSKYMYIEASSPNYPSKSANLVSPCFDLSNATEGTLSFAYHMYGTAMGSLHIDYSLDQGATWANDAWSVTGDQTNIWKPIALNITTLVGQSVQFRFRGLTGTSYTSDICIDDVSLTTGSGSTPPPAVTYCTPSATNGTADGDYVGGVSLGTISNLSNGGGADYKDYTAMSTVISKNGNYSLTVQEGAYAPDRYAAWIDYNQDGDFTDSGEKLGEFTGNSAGSAHNISFIVPNTATSGNTRLRVRCLYNGNANNISPCGTGDYGETEDYTVQISASRNRIMSKSLVGEISSNVFPNPTSGKVYVNISSDIEQEASITLTNPLGVEIEKINLNMFAGKTKTQFDLISLPAGTYYIVISVGEFVKIERVIKQ